MEINGLNISKVISIRLNKQEHEYLLLLLKKYGIKSKTKLIKQILFGEIKPFLPPKERDLIISYIIELNYIGKNLNQLLKYGANNDVVDLLPKLKELIKNGKKIL
jgi:hypothetical protein